MLVLELFAWWYGPGWSEAIGSINKMLTGISHAFSAPILLRTLFAPWKRVVTYPGDSLDAKFRALGDNIVSRAIGFSVRLLVLFTALVLSLLSLVLGLICIVLWPLVPLGILALLIKAIIG